MMAPHHNQLLGVIQTVLNILSIMGLPEQGRRGKLYSTPASGEYRSKYQGIPTVVNIWYYLEFGASTVSLGFYHNDSP